MPVGIYKRKPFTEEHKIKISEGLKGKKNSLGHKQTDEHKQKIGLAGKGNIRALGKHWKLSEETKKKMSIWEQMQKKIFMKNIKVIKAVNELVANGGSVASAMRKAGYSARTARTPKKMTDTQAYQDEIKPVVKQLEEERQEVINDMKGKRGKAKYRDLTDALDKITKNIQLLGGKPTENNKVEISWM